MGLCTVNLCGRNGAGRRVGGGVCVSSTFAHKEDGGPQRGLARRDGDEEAVETGMAQAGAVHGGGLGASAEVGLRRDVQLDEQLLTPEGDERG